jgi:hypothetical protein
MMVGQGARESLPCVLFEQAATVGGVSFAAAQWLVLDNLSRRLFLVAPTKFCSEL